MLRFSGCALIVLYALTVTASAETISFQPTGAFEVAVDLTDATLQPAVITAAPTDWHDTSGADVWWVTLDGQRFQVQVFPALERPGAGEPNCCLHFTVDDTEFWLKVLAVSSLRPSAEGAAEESPAQSSGGNAPDLMAVLEALMPHWSSGAAGDPRLVHEAMVLGPRLREDLFTSSSPGAGGESQAEQLQSEGGSPESQFVLAQVPEPGLLMLMGLGAATALRRARTIR
jgi:hypothetical protein